MKNINETTYYVEGPNWEATVSVDTDINTEEKFQLLEAGTLAIEKRLSTGKDIQFGPILLIRRASRTAKEAQVNTYLCLINAAQYKAAEDLRSNYKKSSGEDLSLDQNGFAY